METMNSNSVSTTAPDGGEALFHTLADLMPSLCWMANADGWLFWYNSRWYEYTGATPEQMKGWGWQSVHDPAMLPQVLERWQSSIATGKAFEMTFPLRGADGKFRPFLTRIAPVIGADGRVMRWLGVNTDITDERRNAEILERLVEERTAALMREVEERRRAEESLRQSEKLRALGQLTGGVAHDFNNIIQVIAAGAEVLKRPNLSEKNRSVILDSCVRASQNAKKLVERLLAFARQQPLRPEAFNCNECISNIADMLRRTLGFHISVQVEAAPDVCLVYVDPSQFEVAVLNLALNARDAMSKNGGGVLTLRSYNVHLGVTADHAAGDYVCVEVRDTGEGMTSHVLSHIFEPFFTTKEPGHGTGLGLPQVHGFVKQSGGDIEVKSTLGDGAVISLYLPCAKAEPATEVDVLPKTQVDALGSIANKMVLVVDDNADVASLTTALLEQLGYRTHCARSAAEALEILRRGEPVIDAVISDVAMSGMNGIELANILRLRHPALPVVLATGYSEMLTRWTDEIPREILRKPYSQEQLAAALERAFGRRAA